MTPAEFVELKNNPASNQPSWLKNPATCEATADCASVTSAASDNLACGTLDLSLMIPRLEGQLEGVKK